MPLIPAGPKRRTGGSTIHVAWPRTQDISPGMPGFSIWHFKEEPEPTVRVKTGQSHPQALVITHIFPAFVSALLIGTENRWKTGGIWPSSLQVTRYAPCRQRLAGRPVSRVPRQLSHKALRHNDLHNQFSSTNPGKDVGNDKPSSPVHAEVQATIMRPTRYPKAKAEPF